MAWYMVRMEHSVAVEATSENEAIKEAEALDFPDEWDLSGSQVWLVDE